MKKESKVKQIVQSYVDGVANTAAKKAAKDASADMIHELIAQLQELGKTQEALAIVDRLGDVYFSYAQLTWDGELFISREQFMLLDTVNYKPIVPGSNYYVSERLNVNLILEDLGRCGFEVVSSHPAGTGFSYFLKKRLYSRPKSTR